MTPPAYLTAELGAAVVVFTLFIVVYALRSSKIRWFRSPFGRMIMFAHVSTDALLIWSLTGALWPEHHDYRRPVFAVLLGLLIIAGAWQLTALMREVMRDS